MVALADMVAAVLMLGPLLLTLVVDGGLSARQVLRPFALALVSGLAVAALAGVLPPLGAAHGLVGVVLLARNGLALLIVFAGVQLVLRRTLPPRLPYPKEPL